MYSKRPVAGLLSSAWEGMRPFYVLDGPTAGNAQEELLMKKMLKKLVVWLYCGSIIAIPLQVEGKGFTVTQYILTSQPLSNADAASMRANSAYWKRSPIVAEYNTIAFADNADATIYYPMRSFPSGTVSGRDDYFSINIMGSVLIPRKGSWTFSIGHDDGFVFSVSHNGREWSFSRDTWSSSRTTNTFEFPEAGIYKIHFTHYQSGGPAMLELTVAEGVHASFNASVFKLVGTEASGIVFADYDNVVVHFNANGGVGNEMDEQVFNAGEEQKLSKNTYRKDGYVFQGWATNLEHAVVGTVDYKDEAVITADSDMTLYAVWANPPLTLTAESANWSSGSITLRCEDADTSGAAHTYSLEYKNEIGIWTNVNEAAANNIAVSADGFAHLADNTFWSRLGGVPPVEYRVKDENGRVSAGCVTRTKYGVFVGLSRWSPSAYKKSLANLGDESNARKFRRLAVEQGSFDGNNITMLVDGEATTNAVSNAFTDKARRAVAGDVCVFYFSTHGGVSENNGAAALAFYDGRYDDEALASDIARLDAANKGIAVIGIVHACHSVAMYDNPSLDFERTKWYLKNGLAQCSPNVAWITSAARVKESSYGTFNIFMLDYGWEEGFAGAGDSLTFGELAQYTKSRYDAVFSGIVFDHDHGSYSKEVNIENTTILSRVMAGRRGSHDTNAVVPAAPQGVAASQGLCNTRVGVSWNPVADATAYTVFYRVGDGEKWTGCCWRYAERPRDGKYEYWKDAEDLEKECSYSFKGRDENSPVFFAVKAFNGAGVSDLSDIVKGWMDYKGWWGGAKEWLLECHPSIVSAAAGDVIAAAGLTAACGTKTIEKCYALGIDPEDPDDDFKVTHFEMKDGKPVITLNHTEDGSGNSFLPRVKTLGKADLSDAEWREVPEEGDDTMRFFKVEVEMP